MIPPRLCQFPDVNILRILRMNGWLVLVIAIMENTRDRAPEMAELMGFASRPLQEPLE